MAIRCCSMLVLVLWGSLPDAHAQVDEGRTGLWNMYFWNAAIEGRRWGFQGDVQYRTWDVGTDLEQLLLRGGLTWRPASAGGVLLTLGYANITTGEFGPGDDTFGEHRSYQEALLSQRLGDRLYLRHRFRSEQRWVDDQDFRTRYRYAIFAELPLNGTALDAGAIYLAVYNEVFINGERDIGDGREVSLFDRNRTYAGLGYGLSDTLRFQFGYMHQETEDIGKGQLQLSLHHAF